MVDASGQDDEIIFVQEDTNPRVLFASDVKVSLTTADISNLLVFVQVLVEERLDFLLVHIAHLLGGHEDFVAVLVSSIRCKLIDVLEIREMVVMYSEAAKVFDADLFAGVMLEALVALYRTH